MKKQKTWTAILDGARAQLFDLELNPVRLVPHSDGCFTGTRLLTHDLTTDRPGHGQKSGGGGRHALEPHTDAHVHREEVFVSDIAHRLAKDAGSGAYERLIVIAPARALGDFRAHFPENIRKQKVKLEIVGDWTKMSPKEASEHLRPHLVEAGMIVETSR